MPTSITFEEDKIIVMKILNELTDYTLLNAINIFEGIKDYVSKSSLYGNKILSESNKGIRKEEDSVKLMTLHASKGLEFSQVFISGANLGSIPIISRDEAGEHEEKRLFFVGITRARDNLEISYHTKPEDFGVYSIPSPYLRMIPEELIESEDFGSRASSLNQLRREIKINIDKKTANQEVCEMESKEAEKTLVVHDKYGQGEVTSEDENSITVIFPIYGEKTFSKMFCPLKFTIK
jgi:DNA helicase-2/ATP-dependent DNA helicase PcrA